MEHGIISVLGDFPGMMKNYYLLGYDSDAEQIKYCRVDKMLHIKLSGENREGKEFFNKLDRADYAKKSFGMFGEKEQTVKLLVKKAWQE